LLYILLGQDDFSLNHSLEEIKKTIGDQTLLVANTTTLDGQQITLDQLRTVCETVPFLAERRLVIVNGLLERFEPKGKSSRRGKNTHVTNQQDEYKSLAAYITKIPDSTILVLIDGKIRSDNPLFTELSVKAEVRSFPPLKDTKLRQWIQRYVAKDGGSISPQAVNLIAKLVGSNLWTMSNEINKLLLFTSGRRIEEEDVNLVVSCVQEANVFTMVDAILGFKAKAAQQSLQQLLHRGTAPSYLLVMLSRQVQMIVRARELRNQREPKTEIQNRLGLTSEFALRRTLEQADRYSWERLKQVYHKLLEADLRIKTGRYDAELTLNILIAELCHQGKV
jgi:DNA polymerase-3 subunit delta